MVDELREHVINNPKFSFKNEKDDPVILYEDEKEEEAGDDEYAEVEVSLEIEPENQSVDLKPEQKRHELSGRNAMNGN